MFYLILTYESVHDVEMEFDDSPCKPYCLSVVDSPVDLWPRAFNFEIIFRGPALSDARFKCRVHVVVDVDSQMRRIFLNGYLARKLVEAFCVSCTMWPKPDASLRPSLESCRRWNARSRFGNESWPGLRRVWGPLGVLGV